MISRQSVLSALLTAAVLFPLAASADRLSFDTTLLGQGREDENNVGEFPFNGYLGLQYSRPGWWNLSSETNMRLFRDWKRGWDDYDLYQAVVHVTPGEIVQIDFGRQFLSQGFTTDLVDGLKLTIRPPWPVEFTTYSGIPRTVERGDFNDFSGTGNGNDGLLSGLSVRIKEIPRTNLQLHTAWRKANIRVGDLRENDAVLVGADASVSLGGAWKPLLYGVSEVNTTGKVMETGTLGLDLYPRSWASFNLEFDYFNTDRNFARQSILELLADGRILSGSIGSTWTLIPDFLEMTESYSLQNITVNGGNRRNGHLLEVAFPITFDSIGLDIGPGYYFSKSFGGDLHGLRIAAHERFNEKWDADLGFDVTTYDKVTGDNDNAFSTVLWTGYEILKDLKLAAGFEFNKNNLFDRDIRGSFKLQYNYGFDI